MRPRPRRTMSRASVPVYMFCTFHRKGTMSTTALNTGVTGHDRTYHAERLLRKWHRVIRVERRAWTRDRRRLDELGATGRQEFADSDLADRETLSRVPGWDEPQRGAQPACADRSAFMACPALTRRPARPAASVRTRHWRPRQEECDATRPYADLDDLHAARARSFSRSGSGQAPDFPCPTSVQPFARIGRKRRTTRIEIADTRPLRGSSDVRDVAWAHHRRIELSGNGAASNVCSVEGARGHQLTQELERLSDIEVQLEIDAARTHATDAPSLIGRPSKHEADSAWRGHSHWASPLLAVLAIEAGR